MSQWGHDFRPEYLELSVLHERFPDVPRIALTATADPQTRAEIIARLALDRARDLRVELRPPQHPLHDRRQGRAARAAAALHPRRARGRRGHRLLPVAAQGRRDRGVAADAGRQRAAVPRGHGQRGAQRAPEPLPARGRHRRRRDDRVRHGHRQARRAVRRAPRPAEERRGLLPGDGPRRARRRARRRVDDVRPRRRRAAAAPDRVAPRRATRTSACRPPSSMRCSACARPRAAGACGCSRTSARRASPAAIATPASTPPQTWDATDAARKALSAIYRTGQRFGAVHLIDVLRGKASERVAQVGPRQAAGVRHRRRPGRDRVARRVPAARRARLRPRRPRILRRAAADGGEPAGAQGGAVGRDAPRRRAAARRPVARAAPRRRTCRLPMSACSTASSSGGWPKRRRKPCPPT